MSDVVATLIVPFGEAAASQSGDIVAEWDDTLNLAADGEVKSRFVPGDEAWLLVSSDPGIEIVRVAATDGTVNESGEVMLQRSQDLAFGGSDDTQQLQYLPAGGLDKRWFGRGGDGLEISGKAVSVAANFPCLLRAAYPVRFRRYRLQTPQVTLALDEEYPLIVFIYYREAG